MHSTPPLHETGFNPANELNAAQYEAVSTLDGPVLVIAGAGSGKTRTIVYRLANLVHSGVDASSILLLTFTRKAAQEMLHRAKELLGQRGMGDIHHSGLAAVQGGTFHSFAYSVLRVFGVEGYPREATVMDSADALSLLQLCKDDLKAGRGDRSFPRNQTVMSYLSKSRNREEDLYDIIRQDAGHLLPHAEEIEKMGLAYRDMKKSRGLLDYDDLLFEFERLLRARADALSYCRRRHRYIMVDEFQDTNRVQSRLTALLAGALHGAEGAMPGSGNIMAVGDDAQSIYAFRGANVNNILDFPKTYPGTRVIRLEENYRSTQPLLDLSNGILARAPKGFKKKLFTRQPGADKPRVYRPMSDLSQGRLAASTIVELLRDFPPHEIAVLFRASFHSYHLEVELNKLGLHFRKFGGIRYSDAAHIKDAMAFVRLVLNPLDFTAFRRVTDFIKGVGPKTSLKLHQALQLGDSKTLDKAFVKHPDLKKHLDFVNKLHVSGLAPGPMLELVLDHYQPVLEEAYPDDYPKRRQGLDELLQIAAGYTDIDLFVADLSLDDPLAEEEIRDCITLSTIHSAKGLEWGAVIILDLVEERFPSRYAIQREEDFEEERRLMYVACTRAKRYLGLFSPATLYDRGRGGNNPAVPSPFLRELSPALYEEWQESYAGGWARRGEGRAYPAKGYAATSGYAAPAQSSQARTSQAQDAENTDFDDIVKRHGYRDESARKTPAAEPKPDEPAPPAPAVNALKPEECGYCTHKIFGRGKIIKFMPPDKYQVNFPGVGVKVIMGAYLVLEDK